MIIISIYKYISYKQLINNYADNVRDIPAYGWFIVTVRKCCTYKLLLTTKATLLPTKQEKIRKKMEKKMTGMREWIYKIK